MDNQAQRLPREEHTVPAEADLETPGETSETPPPTKPIIIIKVQRNGMEATLLLHQSSPDTLPPLREDLDAALAEQHIVSGINNVLLDDLCVKPVYYHVFIIARGTPAMVGRDGFVEYLVSAAIIRRPRIREDGLADYKNIGFPVVVYKNQPLAEISFAEKGEDGEDIHGNVLEGMFGRDPMDPVGANTALNEDGTKLLATIDGRVGIQAGVVSVIEVLKIDENVDNATGNICFTGDVIVGGDVLTSFVIKCGGSIVVHGSVEGAILEAGADISVSAGVFGMEKGSVFAGNDIKCRFIQNCTVRATGNVYADSIMFSDIACNGDLELVGKKGALIGGRCSVAGKLIAKTIGTAIHVPTEINMSPTGTEKTEEIGRLKAQIKSLDAGMLKITQLQNRYADLNKRAVLKPEQVKELLAAKALAGQLQEQRKAAENQLAAIKLEQQQTGKVSSYIECKGRVHSNTKITFGNAELVVDKSFVNSRIQVSDKGIEILPL